MDDKKENLPLDTRLLSDAIIELNISRHNVSIYPRNHPIVEKSLNRAFDFLQKLFELRQEITLAVAKDTLIIDGPSLDKQNPVYKDFALCLSSINIAYVKFMSGLTKDELYSFHSFIQKNIRDASREEARNSLKEHKLIHINVEFIDYAAFQLNEGQTEQEKNGVPIWELYVLGLLEGRSQPDEASDIIQRLPPETLAALINRVNADSIKEEAYDRVITSYVRTSSERAFTARDLRKLIDFISELRPELKSQFLSSAVNTVSRDVDSIHEVLGDMPVDDIMEMLSIIDRQMVVIPEALKNVLDKFSRLQFDKSEVRRYGKVLLEDDILLSPEVTALLEGADFKAFVSDAYQQEIQRLLKFDARKVNIEWIKEFENEWSDEYIEKIFQQIIMELFSSGAGEIESENECEYFTNILRDEIGQCIDTGQYKQVLDSLRVLGSGGVRDRFPDIINNTLAYYHSGEFISTIVNSLRIIGKERRADALLFCEYYDAQIIPYLMDALTDEESQSVRRFILGLIIHFGEKALPEAIRRLEDKRWFVKRNMLFILNECSNEDALKKAREYCNDENPRVSFEAVKCLLKARDSYGIKALKEFLGSKNIDIVKRAVALAGAFRVKDVVPDLINILKKRTLTGMDFEDKVPIVHALGQIGDPRALDALGDILSSKTFMFKNSLDILKEETRNSLKNYPDEEARDLMEKAGIKREDHKTGQLAAK
jgi:hypothetical protein